MDPVAGSLYDSSKGIFVRIDVEKSSACVACDEFVHLRSVGLCFTKVTCLVVGVIKAS